MLMETYLCFHCLENVSSQQMYRALIPQLHPIDKKVLCIWLSFGYINGMDVSETPTTFWSVGY